MSENSAGSPISALVILALNLEVNEGRARMNRYGPGNNATILNWSIEKDKASNLRGNLESEQRDACPLAASPKVQSIVYI